MKEQWGPEELAEEEPWNSQAFRSMSRRQQNLEIYKVFSLALGFSNHTNRTLRSSLYYSHWYSRLLDLCKCRFLYQQSSLSAKRCLLREVRYLVDVRATQRNQNWIKFSSCFSPLPPIRLKTFSAGWKMLRMTGMLLWIILQGERFSGVWR